MNLLKICIISSFLGVLGVILLSGYVEPTGYAIMDLSEDYLGTSVVVEGIVESLYTSKNGHNFLSVSDDTGSIKVVAFKGTGVDGAEMGSRIRVRGKLDTYQQELEIIAREITLESP
ncbi:MAG: OB-fold nucleic acid binding domain-containing protein [Candidatus Aenigmatarchaeota archaeon]